MFRQMNVKKNRVGCVREVSYRQNSEVFFSLKRGEFLNSPQRYFIFSIFDLLVISLHFDIPKEQGIIYNYNYFDQLSSLQK